ncbi:MAG: efflux RND transporter periplasmic adaptor subunit [Phycisphaerae bacterium]
MAKKPALVMVGGLVLAVGVLGAALGWIPFAGSSQTSLPRATYTAQRRDLTISVTEAGEIQARSYTDYVCEVEGTTTIADIVPEGTRITADDVANRRIIVQLDSAEIEERLTRQQIDFAEAEANFTEAQEALEIQRKQNESDVKAAELAVRFGLMDLQKYLSEEVAAALLERIESSGRPADAVVKSLIQGLVADPAHPQWGGAALQNKRLLESAIKLAESTLKRDGNRLLWTQKLSEKGYVAGLEVERDQLAYEKAQIEVQQAQTALALFLRYDFAKQVEKLISDYQEAKRQLERTRASARATLAQAQAKLRSAEASFNLQKERLEKLEKQLAACTIRATAPGMVIYGTSTNYYARMRDPIEIGDGVHKGQKIITIPDTAEMDAIVRVHESWVERIKPGLPVRVVADPFPDRVFTGQVIRVAPLPDPQSRYMRTGLKVYTTQVALEGEQRILRPGMSAKVEIIIDQLTNVLCVPLQAVATRWGGKVCYVVSRKGLEARPVETGQFNASFIEIKDGLAEGEFISLVPPQFDDEDEPQDDDNEEDAGARRPDPDDAGDPDQRDPDGPPGPADDETARPPAPPASPAGAGTG